MFKVCCTTLGHAPVCFQYVQYVVLSRVMRSEMCSLQIKSVLILLLALSGELDLQERSTTSKSQFQKYSSTTLLPHRVLPRKRARSLSEQSRTSTWTPEVVSSNLLIFVWRAYWKRITKFSALSLRPSVCPLPAQIQEQKVQKAKI